jgi:hypothetical protein
MPRKRRKTDAAPSKRTPQSSDGMPAPMHAPESIVAVGDSSLVLSTIGKCLDEERVFDIQSVLDNIDQIHSDAAGIEQAEERLEQVLRGVFAYCHDVHNACLKAVVAVTAELMCTLQVSVPRRSAYDNWQIIMSTVKKITADQRGGLGVSVLQNTKFYQVVRKLSQLPSH